MQDDSVRVVVTNIRESVVSEYADMARASANIDSMISKYTGNFDILDDDNALDDFLENLVISLGSDVVQMTPDDLVVNEHAGMIMRRDVDSICVGVDEDVPPSGLIVPIYDGINEFFSTIDKVVVKKKKNIFDVPKLEYYLDPKTKPGKRTDIDTLVTAFYKKGCVFVCPSGTFENALIRQSIFYYTDIDDCISKYKKGAIVLAFDLKRFQYDKFVKLRIPVCVLRYSPFLPISVRYTKDLDYNDDAVCGHFFASRKYTEFRNWYPPDGTNRYTPTYWVNWLGLAISAVHIEFLAYEIITNLVFPRVRESLFAPYLVDVGGFSSDCVLPAGSYHANNVSGVIEIGALRVYNLIKCQLVDINSTPDGLIIRVLVRDKEFEFETKGQYPITPNYYHFNGDYFKLENDNSLNDCMQLSMYDINCPVAMGYSHTTGALVRGVIAISPLTLAYTYHKVGRAAYEHQIMNEMSVVTNLEYDNYVYDIDTFHPPPLGVDG